jgi:hypothetical protein
MASDLMGWGESRLASPLQIALALAQLNLVPLGPRLRLADPCGAIHMQHPLSMKRPPP